MRDAPCSWMSIMSTNTLQTNKFKFKRLHIDRGFPYSSVGKSSACNAGGLSLIPGSGRSPGEGYRNPLQYTCLENSLDRGAWQATVHEVSELEPTEWFSFSLFVVSEGFPGGASGKEPTCQCGRHRDVGLIPGWRRSLGEGNGNSLQYSCLENSLDRGAGRTTAYGVARAGHDLTTKPTNHKHKDSPW